MTELHCITDISRDRPIKYVTIIYTKKANTNIISCQEILRGLLYLILDTTKICSVVVKKLQKFIRQLCLMKLQGLLERVIRYFCSHLSTFMSRACMYRSCTGLELQSLCFYINNYFLSVCQDEGVHNFLFNFDLNHVRTSVS